MKKNCYKRTDGRWQYSKQINGMLYYTIANTYRELLENIKNITPRKIKNVKTIKTKSVTFSQYYEFFIENYIKTQKIRKTTIQDWIGQLENYIKPYFQNIPMEKLTTEFIQKFINKIEKERTQEVLFQRIKRVLKKAFVTGKIKKDLSIGIEKANRTNKQERTPLTYNEQIKFLNAIKHTEFYTFCIFSLIVGSRREETLRFNLNKDIDEEQLVINIKETKMKKVIRKVNVTQEFITFLKTNMKTNMFPHHEDYYTKNIGNIFKDLNIKNCLHGLRHTCSANLYFLGAKDKYRQLQLGHSSIITTNNIYTNIKENIPKALLQELYGRLYPNFD